ncbi:HTH-type transcriptional regulator CymR [subsurface metagenome]|nr:Rrf2 family transcriptional regulator [Clostridia bacterium]
MLLSTKGEYGVRCMLDLAIHYGQGPISIRDISKREGISKNYIEQLFVRLRHAKLIKSVRGPKGGYLLISQPRRIKIGDVVRALEGPIAAIRCVQPQNSKDLCERISTCVLYILWKRLTDKINEVLDSTTLEGLCREGMKLSKHRLAHPLPFQI